MDPAQDEVLVEPGDVADLPQKRIDDGEPLAHKLVPVQAFDQGAGAAMGVAQHIGLAAKADGASKNVMTHSMHVSASANNVVTRADELVAVAQQIRAATTAAEANAHLADFNMLAQQLYAGVDANQDGRVGWQTGEGGLQQAETHMQLMIKGEGA